MSDSQEYTGIPGVKARLFNPHSICLVFMVWLLTNQSRLYPQPDDLSRSMNFILLGIWKLDPFTQTQHINFCSLTKKSFKVIYIYIFFFHMTASACDWTLRCCTTEAGFYGTVFRSCCRSKDDQTDKVILKCLQNGKWKTSGEYEVQEEKTSWALWTVLVSCILV